MQPFLLLLTAFVAVVMQSTLANLWTWSGARIEFLPSLVAYAAFSTRWPLPLWLALAGGIFQDALSANRLGVSSLALGAVATAGFFARNKIYRNQWLVQFVVGGLASLLSSLLAWILLVLGGLGWTVSWVGILRVFQIALLSFLVTPFFFRALDHIRGWTGELQADWGTSSS